MIMAGEHCRNVDIGLIHYPVVNKKGETIGSAVTNLDVHDIARAAKTYGVDNYYIVTPYQEQRQLVETILKHWLAGYGGKYNPARKLALDLVSVTDSIEQLVDSVTQRHGLKPLLLTTSAKQTKKTISYQKCRTIVESNTPILLLFGTAHGMAQTVMDMADHTLPPINGAGEYNHLSVRSAVSIILDRILATWE